MVTRGDVVMMPIPFTDTQRVKVRPALVVLNDFDNARLRKTIVATITSNLRHINDPSHLLIDPGHPDGLSSGLKTPSLASCNNLYTVEQDDVIRTIGHLSDPLLASLNDCLKAALEIT